MTTNDLNQKLGNKHLFMKILLYLPSMFSHPTIFFGTKTKLGNYGKCIHFSGHKDKIYFSEIVN